MDNTKLYHFIRQSFIQELGICEPPTFLEEELLCRLSALLYHFRDLSRDPLELQIQHIIQEQQPYIQRILIHK